MRSVLPFVALLSTTTPLPATEPAALEGTVVRVVDGDTIHVRIGSRVEKVRLYRRQHP